LFCPKNKKLLGVTVKASRIIQKLFNNSGLSGFKTDRFGLQKKRNDQFHDLLRFLNFGLLNL